MVNPNEYGTIGQFITKKMEEYSDLGEPHEFRSAKRFWKHLHKTVMARKFDFARTFPIDCFPGMRAIMQIGAFYYLATAGGITEFAERYAEMAAEDIFQECC